MAMKMKGKSGQCVYIPIIKFNVDICSKPCSGCSGFVGFSSSSVAVEMYDDSRLVGCTVTQALSSAVWS